GLVRLEFILFVPDVLPLVLAAVVGLGGVVAWTVIEILVLRDRRDRGNSRRCDQDVDERAGTRPRERQPADVRAGLKASPSERDFPVLAVGQPDWIGSNRGVALVGAQDGGIHACLGGPVVWAREQVHVDPIGSRG